MVIGVSFSSPTRLPPPEGVRSGIPRLGGGGLQSWRGAHYRIKSSAIAVVVTSASCFSYTLPLGAPLSVGGRTLRERRGAVLRLEGEEGAVGWGEAAPLPGFSDESLTDAVDALRERAGSLPGTSVPRRIRALPPPGTTGDPPSVRFALDSALLELRAATEDADVPSLLGAEHTTIALNALVGRAADDLTATGERLRRDGYRAVKLKVGKAAPERDATRVRALRRGLGARTALRLDANRAWSFEEALSFAEALPGSADVEYVEEPLADPGRLVTFTDRTGLPVALDESTRERDPSTIPEALLLGGVVLKPTLLGGLRRAHRWARWADRRGASVVLSGAYESGVGTRLLGALAAAWSEAPVGLSTYTRLADDLLRPRLALEGPTFEVTPAYRSRVESSLLRPIDRP